MGCRACLHSINTANGRIAKYLEQKQKLQLTTFIIKPDGSTFFLVDGKEIPEKKFLQENQVSLIPLARENFDKTKNWMNDKKSY